MSEEDMGLFSFFKIKIPRLEDEFIQDPAERLIEEGRAGKTGRLPVHTSPEEERKELEGWIDEFQEKHWNPASPIWHNPWEK